MAVLGLSPELWVLFVGFGFMVGVFFGFFGMGGSFLVTPTLLILGYPASVAIGSSMAFVFGTAVIATLKHNDIGQVDYKLGGLMFAGIVLGIEAGKMLVFGLKALGRAELVVGIAYILLLAAIGLVFTRNALRQTNEDDATGESDSDPNDIPELAKTIKSYDIPPMVTLTDGSRASMWVISGVGGGVGVVSGFLGVGGGLDRKSVV